MHQLTPERRFAALVAEDASRPFVTYYDEVSGERSELSRKSLANWVAKTRNLLGDELGLGVGDTVAVALPMHWLAAPIVLGCLAAGVTIASDGAVDAAFGTPDSVADLDVDDRFVIDPARGAFGFGDAAPAGTTDYVSAVRPQGDAWAAVSMPAGPADPAVVGTTRGELLAAASERAEQIGLTEGGRLLVVDDASWHETVLLPLAVGGSVVMLRQGFGAGPVPDDIVARRAEQERVTVRR